MTLANEEEGQHTCMFCGLRFQTVAELIKHFEKEHTT